MFEWEAEEWWLFRSKRAQVPLHISCQKKLSYMVECLYPQVGKGIQYGMIKKTQMREAIDRGLHTEMPARRE